MRILNENALKADIDTMFDSALAYQTAAIRNWFKGTWLKPLLKNQWFAENFLHPIKVVGGGLFDGLGDDDNGYLVSRVAGRKVSIREYTEFDVKDARKGLLYWYQPTTHSILHFKNLEDVVLVRDYLTQLTEATPDFDLRKVNAQDAVKAATKWHEETVRRAEEARLRQEEENKIPALKSWRTMKKGEDWEPIAKLSVHGVEYAVIRLTSPKALRIEGESMAHCIYSYTRNLYQHPYVFLSIRTKKDLYQPLFTAEVHNLSPVVTIQLQPWHNGVEFEGRQERLPVGFEKAFLDLMKDQNVYSRFGKLDNPNEFEVKRCGPRI